MSSAVETSRDVTVEPGHGVESLAPPERCRGCVAASTSFGMAVMRCCDHIEIGTGKIRYPIFRVRSFSHSRDMELAPYRSG
jgi:hypothetical protein